MRKYKCKLDKADDTMNTDDQAKHGRELRRKYVYFKRKRARYALEIAKADDRLMEAAEQDKGKMNQVSTKAAIELTQIHLSCKKALKDMFKWPSMMPRQPMIMLPMRQK